MSVNFKEQSRDENRCGFFMLVKIFQESARFANIL